MGTLLSSPVATLIRRWRRLRKYVDGWKEQETLCWDDTVLDNGTIKVSTTTGAPLPSYKVIDTLE